MKKGVVILSLAIMVLGANYSSQESKESWPKPKINFYGILKDITVAEKYKVENVTISRMYSRIPVYAVPKDPNANPSDHTTYIDLDEEYQIKQSLPHDSSVIRFKNRDYVKIEVISKGTKKHTRHYLVEKSRKIYCEEMSEAGPKEKELNFKALDTLTILGYKKHATKNKKESELDVSTTKEIIKELEAEADKVAEKGVKNKIKKLAKNLKQVVKDTF